MPGRRNVMQTNKAESIQPAQETIPMIFKKFWFLAPALLIYLALAVVLMTKYVHSHDATNSQNMEQIFDAPDSNVEYR